MMERTRVAAYGLAVQDGRMLLCRISQELPDNVGKWTLPGGGIDFGEHPEDAVVREVEEESGYQVRVSRVRIVDSECFEVLTGRFHALRILYDVEVVGGDMRHEQAGSTDLCAWWTREEIEGLPTVPVARLGARLAFGT